MRPNSAARVTAARLTMALVALVLVGTSLQAPAEARPGQGAGELAQEPGAPPDAADESSDGKVLLLSVPGLTWADVEEHDLPVMESFFEDAALANHAPRGVTSTSGPGAAYLTISAGARATGHPDVDGQQLELEDRSAGSAAGEIFQRRTGVEADGDYVALSWSEHPAPRDYER
jgi:hypothetical protein